MARSSRFFMFLMFDYLKVSFNYNLKRQKS